MDLAVTDATILEVEADVVSFKSIIAGLSSSSSISIGGGETVEVVVGRETEVIRVRNHWAVVGLFSFDSIDSISNKDSTRCWFPVN